MKQRGSGALADANSAESKLYSDPQGLKPKSFTALAARLEAVPFPKPAMNPNIEDCPIL